MTAVGLTVKTADTTTLYSSATSASVTLADLKDGSTIVAIESNKISITEDSVACTFVDKVDDVGTTYGVLTGSDGVFTLTKGTNETAVTSVSVADGVSVTFAKDFVAANATGETTKLLKVTNGTDNTFSVNSNGKEFTVVGNVVSGENVTAISLTKGSVVADITSGKTLTVGDFTYKATEASEVQFTQKTVDNNSTITPEFISGTVQVTGGSSEGKISVNDVEFTLSSATTLAITSVDSVVSGVEAVKGDITATFNDAGDVLKIGNVTYTGTTTSTNILFNAKSSDSSTITGGSIDLSTGAGTNTYTVDSTTVVAGVGAATIGAADDNSSVEITGSAAEVTVAKTVSNATDKTAFTLNGEALNISGDKDGYKVAIGEGGTFGEISGISGGAVVTAAAEKTLKTDSQGKFK